MVTLPQTPEANEVIGNTILDRGARAVSAVPLVPPVSPGSDSYLVAETAEAAEKEKKLRGPRLRYPLRVMGEEILVDSPLVGRHQLRNIALAIAAAGELHQQGWTAITPASIERGIRETHWPGRFQVIKAQRDEPEYVLDVAHNPAGAWALRSTLSMAYGERPLTMVFGVMRDKAVSEIAEILFPIAEHVIVTHAESPRSATPAEIHRAASRVSVEIREAESVTAALAKARQLSSI